MCQQEQVEDMFEQNLTERACAHACAAQACMRAQHRVHGAHWVPLRARARRLLLLRVFAPVPRLAKQTLEPARAYDHT